MSAPILKPFFVTIAYTAVVMAESESDARAVADAQAHEICREEAADITTGSEVTRIADLKAHGWCGEELAYGGDGQTKLKDVLSALESLPTRDTKTIDMFAGASA
ncbi:hypothetical protein QYH69_34055 [Paraburkholderia sp. SARCC-3016]|uniref:hypothetical protein n=1 Tax=Paraburkholderia sp. SARCC-3016 TaxID=3058611 RepID=UPI0028073BFE|nr:hypothetical protein [Paraburkholderia sp. SARCC-3016]MDQ7982250.1 hypothetical protein [Paraburkholderia sp. SARCC-3016]